MEGREVEIEIALDRLVSPDDEIAKRGFDALYEICLPVTIRWAGLSLKGDYRDEAVQMAWIKVWNARKTYVPRGCSAWKGYLFRVVRTAVVDVSTSREKPLTEIDFACLGIEDMELLFDFLDARLFEKAIGEVWCGYPARLSQADRLKRVLAAKMVLIQKKPLVDVRRTVLPGLPAPEADKRIEAWVQDPAVLGDLAFRILHLDAKGLTSVILGIPLSDLISTMQKAITCQEGEPPAGWTWSEVAAVCQRYFMNRPVDEIEKDLSCSFQPIGDRCRGVFPFQSRMKALKRTFGEQAEVLAKPGLWKRIAFICWFQEFLRQKDILERYEGAAMEGGYKGLTASNLNVWFGNRRLINELLRHMKEQGIDL